MRPVAPGCRVINDRSTSNRVSSRLLLSARIFGRSARARRVTIIAMCPSIIASRPTCGPYTPEQCARKMFEHRAGREWLSTLSKRDGKNVAATPTGSSSTMRSAKASREPLRYRVKSESHVQNRGNQNDDWRVNDLRSAFQTGVAVAFQNVQNLKETRMLVHVVFKPVKTVP